MKISVLIVTKNREGNLVECLKSLFHVSKQLHEIVVVENNKQKTLQRVVRQFPTMPIRYYREEKSGIAHARNRAVKNSSGDILSFIDDDCVVAPLWLKSVRYTFSQNSNAVALVGRSLNYYPDNFFAQTEQCLYEDWFSKYCPITTVKILKSGVFVNTRNFSIKRNFFLTRKLWFNPSAPYKIEDTEMGIHLFQLLGKNECVVYQPNACIYHKNSTNLIQFLSRPYFTGMGRAYLNKHFDNFEPAGSVQMNKSQAFLPRHMRAISFLVKRSADLGFLVKTLCSL